MDMEFNKVAPEIPEVVVNTNATSEHVAEIKRWIRVIIKVQGMHVSYALKKTTKHKDHQFNAFWCVLAECNASKDWDIFVLQLQRINKLTESRYKKMVQINVLRLCGGIQRK